MNSVAVLQGGCGVIYLGAAGWLLGGRTSRPVPVVIAVAAAVHLGLVFFRWHASGQLPLVSRYEDLTVDALVTVWLYLILQGRRPRLRRPGALALGFAGLLTLAALGYSRAHFPLSPALQSPWLLVHAQLNSLAVAAATLTASVGILWREDVDVLAGRLLAWSLWLWSAMVVAGAWWASLAWGRFWGWDPIESWALATLLAYALTLHLRHDRKRSGARVLRLALAPYGLLLFTTYGLLLVRHSIHGSYLFQ